MTAEAWTPVEKNNASPHTIERHKMKKHTMKSMNEAINPDAELLNEAKWTPLEGKELAAKEKIASKLVKDFHKALKAAGMALDFYGGDATIVDAKAPGGAEDEGAAYGGL